MAITSILSWLFRLTLYVALELKSDQQFKQNKCYKRYIFIWEEQKYRKKKNRKTETKQAQL